jgi:hypothetical protein
MDIRPDDLVKKYAAMGEPELQEFARLYDSLTGPAQDALRAEFARRNLSPDSIGETDDPPVHPQFVTLRRYRDLSEAIVARSLLESAGIPAYLRDENLVRLDWFKSNFIGGGRLQVDASDEPAAAEILAQPIPDTIQFDDGLEFQQPRCPQCSSINIGLEGSSGTAETAAYAVLPSLSGADEIWNCNECGSRWEDAEEDTDEPGISQ